jgi:hypothetical protein
MAANEIDIVYQWIQATLVNDSTLTGYAPGGVWRAEAEASTPAPYVTITYQPGQGRDEIAFGGVRVYSELYFEVCGAGPAKVLATIANAAARIDALLAISQQTAITGGTILASYRTQPVETDPLIDGERWNSNGGVYRVMVKAS